MISPIETVTIRVAILGKRPLICNRMSEKAQHDILLGSQRKTTAEKAANVKHIPLLEYRASPYRLKHDDAPTLIGVPVGAFKGAMMTAALRLPGARKTEIGQLLQVEGDLAPIYGIPELFTAVTRSADINKTPDIRTRAIVPSWATEISITFCTPILNETSVLNLLSAAGQISGVGDWRPEKGKGTYGQFVLTNEDDERWLGVKSTGGRAAQLAAMENPEPYDDETDDLLVWWGEEVERRGKTAQTKGASS